MLLILIGIFLVSFGLIVRSSGLRETRKNSRCSSAAVLFWLVSVEVLITLDGFIL